MPSPVLETPARMWLKVKHRSSFSPLRICSVDSYAFVGWLWKGCCFWEVWDVKLFWGFPKPPKPGGPYANDFGQCRAYHRTWQMLLHEGGTRRQACSWERRQERLYWACTNLLLVSSQELVLLKKHGWRHDLGSIWQTPLLSSLACDSLAAMSDTTSPLQQMLEHYGLRADRVEMCFN